MAGSTSVFSGFFSSTTWVEPLLYLNGASCDQQIPEVASGFLSCRSHEVLNKASPALHQQGLLVFIRQSLEPEAGVLGWDGIAGE